MSNKEEEKLADFGEKIIRSPKGGAFERLLAQHLVLSVSSDPINSIIHGCRSALALEDNVAKKLNVDKEKAETILTIALNFLHAQSTKEDVEYYSIIWSFSRKGKEGFEKFVQPWFNLRFAFFLTHEESTYKEQHDELEKMNDVERFYHGCFHLPVHTFRAMLSAFCAWAYPIVEDLNQKVSTQISPTTYTEILSLFSKFQKEENQQ